MREESKKLVHHRQPVNHSTRITGCTVQNRDFRSINHGLRKEEVFYEKEAKSHCENAETSVDGFCLRQREHLPEKDGGTNEFRFWTCVAGGL